MFNISGLKNRLPSMVDKFHAERVMFIPIKNGGADQTREREQITGVLRVRPNEAKGPQSGNASTFKSKAKSNDAELYLDAANYAEFKIEQGDKIQAIERAGQPFFQVECRNPRDQNRITVELSDK